jgi:hypothetical protein
MRVRVVNNKVAVPFPLTSIAICRPGYTPHCSVSGGPAACSQQDTASSLSVQERCRWNQNGRSATTIVEKRHTPAGSSEDIWPDIPP